jgi:hypothetical protein
MQCNTTRIRLLTFVAGGGSSHLHFTAELLDDGLVWVISAVYAARMVGYLFTTEPYPEPAQARHVSMPEQ